MNDMYLIIANLFRIIKGERYGSAIFTNKKDEEGKKIIYPNQKINEIKKLSENTEYKKIAEVMEYFLEKEVRNAFYHSSYILHNNTFNIRHGKGVLFNGVIDPAVPLKVLVPKAQLGINFALEIVSITQKHIKSYKKEKIVSARILQNEQVENVLLTVNPKYGLTGFRSLTEEEKLTAKTN